MANRVNIVSFKMFLHHYTILCLDDYLFEPLIDGTIKPLLI